MPPVPPSRRAVLQGLAGLTALALVGGCTSGDDGDSSGATPEPDPDLELLARAIGEKQDLLAAYDAATARHPQLTERLRPFRADHEAHLAALTTARPDAPIAAPSPSASPTGPTGPTDPTDPTGPTGPTVSPDRAQAVADLARAELSSANRRIGQCERARDRQLARLLASIGGCEAAHTAVLRSGS